MTLTCSGRGKKTVIVVANNKYLDSYLTAHAAVASNFSTGGALAWVLVNLAAIIAMVEVPVGSSWTRTAALISSVVVGYRWKGASAYGKWSYTLWKISWSRVFKALVCANSHFPVDLRDSSSSRGATSAL
jgi:hypothetical protein